MSVFVYNLKPFIAHRKIEYYQIKTNRPIRFNGEPPFSDVFDLY